MNESKKHSDIDPKTVPNSASKEKPQRTKQPLKRLNDGDEDAPQPDQEGSDR